MKIAAFAAPKLSAKKGVLRSQSQTSIKTVDQVDCDLTRPLARKALDESFRILASHQTQQVASSLTGLPAANWMFHGTAASFDKLENRPNQRVGSQGEVEWSGEAMFAAMDPRVALFYTANRSREVFAGVSLRTYTAPDQPLYISLHGGANLEDALNKAYGDPARPESCLGYIHLLDRSSFVHEQGLGCMEKITRDPAADCGQLVVNRRAALQDMQERNLVKIRWSAE